MKLPQQNGICKQQVIDLLRSELLNYVILFNQKYLECLLQIYLKDYCHPVSTHQSLNCQIPISSHKTPENKMKDSKLVSNFIHRVTKIIKSRLALMVFCKQLMDYFGMKKTSNVVQITKYLFFDQVIIALKVYNCMHCLLYLFVKYQVVFQPD